MGSPGPMQTPGGLSWSAAPLQLPEMPTIQPGADAMSMTIAGLLPAMAASLTTNVTALAAKENMFNAKLGDAQGAYENADQAGGEGVGKMGEMLGQLGQMGQMASAPAQAAGQMGGQFSSLMEPLMKAMEGAKGGGSENGGAPGDGAPGGGGPMGAGPSPQQQQEQREAQQNERESKQDERQTQQDERQTAQDQRQAGQDARDAQLSERSTPSGPPASAPPAAAAGPSQSGPSAGPAPVAPPQAPRHSGDDDLSRRM